MSDRERLERLETAAKNQEEEIPYYLWLYSWVSKPPGVIEKSKSVHNSEQELPDLPLN